MPHSVYTTSDEVLRRSMKLAEELDMMLHIHLSESAGKWSSAVPCTEEGAPWAMPVIWGC